MSGETLAPTVAAEPKVGRRWCDSCGALPASHVKPVLKTVFGFQPMFELPCSVEGCNGAVRITREDLQGLQQAGLLADTFDDFAAMRDLQKIGMELANDKNADAQDRVQGGKLALSVARDRLRMAGYVPEGGRGGGAQVTVNAPGGAVTVEAGDALDRRLDRMFESKRSLVVDAEVVEPAGAATRAPVAVPPASTPDDGSGDLV